MAVFNMAQRYGARGPDLAHYTLHTTHCILHTAHCTLNTAQYETMHTTNIHYSEREAQKCDGTGG